MIELENITLEDLKKEYMKQMEIKESMTQQQQKLKSELNELKISSEENSKKIEEYSQKEQESKLNKLKEKVLSLNVQEKFVDDLISKSGITFDMDDKAINEATAKTFESYPEYKKLHESIKPVIEKTNQDIQGDVVSRYNEIIQKAKKA